MKNFYNTRLLLLLCLVLSFGIITSCNDDDDNAPNSGRVELLSFGPTGVQHGEEIRFIGRNLNKVEMIEFAGATVAKASFLEQKPDLIRLLVPQEAMAGRVTLKLSAGEDVVSKTALSFTVPITVTSVTAEARPGANITIEGTKLTWVEGVVFDRDTVDEFVSQTPTQLVLTVPANAKTGTLLLIGGGEDPTFWETEEELIITLPNVTSVAPASVKHSEVLTLRGTNLDLVHQVNFPGGAEVSNFATQTATEITLSVPNTATAGNLVLVAKGSMVEAPVASNFVVTLPAIASMNAARHGEQLTITGTNLDLVKEVVFAGGAKTSTFASRSATQLVLTVPNTANAGNLKLMTIRDFEVATSNAFNLIVPAITNATPTPVDPGSNLTITGTNLDLVKSVVFGGNATVSTFVSRSATLLVVAVPNTAKNGALKLITNRDYEVTTETNVQIVLPAVASVTPSPVIPGNYLTLNGTNPDLVKAVRFVGGASVTTFLAKTPSQIILTVPNNARSGKITLVTVRDLVLETEAEANIGSAGPNITQYIYENALNNDPVKGWDLWGGWGKESESINNTEQPHRGANAIKLVFNDSWGAFQLHPKNANVLNGFTTLVLYVYGTVNSRMAVQVKNMAGTTGAGVPFDVKAGEYTLVEIPISSLGNISGGINELYIKNFGTNPNTVYLDDIGLR